jgi:hypothetical protein
VKTAVIDELPALSAEVKQRLDTMPGPDCEQNREGLMPEQIPS